MVGKISKVAVLAILLIIAGCKKDEVTKEETEDFLYGTGSTSGNVQNSDAFGALNVIVDDPPPGMLSTGKDKEISLLRDAKSSFLKLYNWNDSIRCFYGTWTHTDVLKEDTTACGQIFYSFWDYVPDTTTPEIILIWDYLGEDGNTHTANLKLFNISFVQDTLLASLSAELKSDGSLILTIDFSASYNPQSEPVSASLLFDAIGVGKFKVDADAASGHSLEDSVFVGKVSGYITDYQRNNYTLNYSFENKEDSSMVFDFSDSNGWRLYVTLAKPVHTQHSGFDPHYYHTVGGEISKDGEHAASLEGEVWVTDPSPDPQHPTWINVIFNDGTRKSLFAYIGFQP